MKRLFLLRHSHAVMSSSDFDRVLSNEGIEKCKSVHDTLAPFSDSIDLVLCSSSIRTAETARLVLPNSPIHYSRDFYNATSKNLLHQLQDITLKHKVVMLIGHNPAISDLASELSGEIITLQPAGLVLLESDIENWAEIDSFNTKLVSYWQ